MGQGDPLLLTCYSVWEFLFHLKKEEEKEILGAVGQKLKWISFLLSTQNIVVKRDLGSRHFKRLSPFPYINQPCGIFANFVVPDDAIGILLFFSRTRNLCDTSFIFSKKKNAPFSKGGVVCECGAFLLPTPAHCRNPMPCTTSLASR